MRKHATVTRTNGFTLLELMVVVVIIAILASIAYPAYSRYAYRARRGDGQNVLMHLATAQERYYSTYNQYTDDPDKLGYGDPIESEKGYYQVTLALGNNDQAFTATATPQNAQAADVCGALSIDNTGDKQPDASNTELNSNGNCW